jgi:hypothetical protein
MDNKNTNKTKRLNYPRYMIKNRVKVKTINVFNQKNTGDDMSPRSQEQPYNEKVLICPDRYLSHSLKQRFRKTYSDNFISFDDLREEF